MKLNIPDYIRGLFHLEDDKVTKDGYALTIYSEDHTIQNTIFANLKELEELRNHINLLLGQ